MRRTLLCLLALPLVLLLTACAGEPSQPSDTYTVERGDTVYTVNTAERTISDGTYAYSYTLSGGAGGYSVEITYPDGSIYYWTVEGNLGYGGWSDGYDPDRYVPGETLCRILSDGAPTSSTPKNGFLILLLLAVGIFNAAAPRAAWYLSYGWRYKDAEPSDAALVVARLGGAAAITAGVILLLA